MLALLVLCSGCTTSGRGDGSRPPEGGGDLCEVLKDVKDQWHRDARSLFSEDDDGHLHLDGALEAAADRSPGRLEKDYEAQLATFYVVSGRTPPASLGDTYMEAATQGQVRINSFAKDRCGFEVWR